MRSPLRRRLRRASWVLMSIGVLLVGYVGVLVGYESYSQHRLEADWQQTHPPGSIGDAQAAFSVQRPHLADGQALARLVIPRIGFDAIVSEGIDGALLSSGPGHDDRTGYPGEGRAILIGNHNGFSMSWGDLHQGDTVQVEMPYGRYRYTITRRSIISGGDDMALARPRSGETLLLVTCWPLWQGALARDRLVLEAVPQGALPATGASA